MNTRRLKTHAGRLTVLAALTLLAGSAATARLAYAGADGPTRTRTQPAIVLRARGVLSLGRYELNLSFSSDGYPVHVSVCSSGKG
ncbi:MAG TPA: hypothetical protein VGV38_22380 [Pyrinomonadaceae bacterium]|nr:hypothetical protein [Pyrinomonadaceae bacterium]